MLKTPLYQGPSEGPSSFESDTKKIGKDGKMWGCCNKRNWY